MFKKLLGGVGVASLALLIAGCGRVAQPTSSPVNSATDTQTEQASPVKASAANATALTAVERRPVTLPLPKPERQLTDEGYSWRQLLSRDSIAPIYDPTFVSAEEAPYDDNELVIGVEINGQAKAYAIGPLNGREMVNDTLGGVPILVTW